MPSHMSLMVVICVTGSSVSPPAKREKTEKVIRVKKISYQARPWFQCRALVVDHGERIGITHLVTPIPTSLTVQMWSRESEGCSDKARLGNSDATSTSTFLNPLSRPSFLYKSLGPQGKEGRRERGICSSNESLIQLIEKPPHWQLILPALLSVQTSEKHSK